MANERARPAGCLQCHGLRADTEALSLPGFLPASCCLPPPLSWKIHPGLISTRRPPEKNEGKKKLMSEGKNQSYKDPHKQLNASRRWESKASPWSRGKELNPKQLLAPCHDCTPTLPQKCCFWTERLKSGKESHLSWSTVSDPSKLVKHWNLASAHRPHSHIIPKPSSEVRMAWPTPPAHTATAVWKALSHT